MPAPARPTPTPPTPTRVGPDAATDLPHPAENPVSSDAAVNDASQALLDYFAQRESADPALTITDPTDPESPEQAPASIPTPPVEPEITEPAPEAPDTPPAAPPGGAEDPTFIHVDRGTPADPSTPPGAPSSPPATVNVGGQDIPVEQVQAALQTLQWAQGLDPAQAQAIADVLSGTHVLTPREQYARDTAASGAGGQVQSSPSGTAPVSPYSAPAPAPAPVAPAAINPDEFVDPALARYVQELDARYQTQLAAAESTQRAQLAQLAQYQARQEQDTIRAEVDAGITSFRAAFPFDDQAMAEITDKAASLQLIPAYRAQGMSSAAATRQALEVAMYSDPVYRGALEQHQLTQMHQQDDQLAARRSRAGALSSGAPVSRIPSPVDARTLSPQDRTSAIAGEIAKYQQAQQ